MLGLAAGTVPALSAPVPAHAQRESEVEEQYAAYTVRLQDLRTKLAA